MNKRLLVISTDAEMSDMLQIYFTRLEYRVDCISSLDAALGMVDSSQPNLILFDSNLSSNELAPIKSKVYEAFPNVPVIWIVAFDDRPDRIAGFELGVDDFISKPFDIEELKLRVGNVIHRVERSSK